MNSWRIDPPKRRDKLYIIAEILEIAKEGILKTQIMYRANLSFTQLNEYLKFMLKINLLESGGMSSHMRRTQRKLAQNLIEFLKARPPAKVLDMGCGVDFYRVGKGILENS